MANSNQNIRYGIIDHALQHCRFTIDELCDYVKEQMGVSVSRRTIENDLNQMEEIYDCIIDRIPNGKTKILRYHDPKFSIHPLSSEDKAIMEQMLALSNAIEGAQHLTVFRRMTSELRDNIHQRIIVNYEYNEYLQGLHKWWETLYDACFNKSTLEICYRDFGNVSSDMVILSPVMLKEYNNRWYVIGVTSPTDELPTRLALDRIVSVAPSKTQYHDTDIDLQEFYDDVIGVTVDTNVPILTIKFEVYGKTAHYIATKPLHPSQRQHWDGDVLTVTLNVRRNYELERTLLSYADSIRILEPEEIRLAHIAKLKAAMERY